MSGRGADSIVREGSAGRANGAHHDRRGACRAEWLAALAAAALAFFGYLLTLHPGLAGGDSAEFQRVGHLLRPAHSPGYPLYVFLLFVWSHLAPFGSWAFRANLFSALCAAAAVGAIVRLACRLRCRPYPAALAALGLAFGGVFWSQALVAEVYALGALLLAATLSATLRLRHERRLRDSLLLGALLALTLAHQPAVVFLVAPAIGLYILLLDGLRRWKRVLTVAAVSLLGLLPYAFVLSHSGSLERGVSVVTASSFRDYFMPFSLGYLLTQRAPLIARIVTAEVGIVGLIAGFVGLLSLARAAWQEATLLLGSAVSVFLFAAAYNVPDVEVFAIPVFVALWGLSAVGLSAACGARWRWLRWAALAAATATPAWQWLHNRADADRSADVRDTRYFEALVRALPPDSSVAATEFPLDQMLAYALSGRRTDVWSIYPNAIEWSVSAGRPTFILMKTAAPPTTLATSDVPVFAESIEEFLGRRPNGEIIALAGRTRDLDESAWRRLLALTGGDWQPRPPDNAVLIGELGARQPLVRVGARVEATVERGARIGTGHAATPGQLQVIVDETGTRIQVAGRLVRAAREGLWLARLRSDGGARVYEVSADLRVASGYRLLRVSRPAAAPPGPADGR